MKTHLMPDYWLETAADLRSAATTLDDPTAKKALGNAAEHCERMALRLQGAEDECRSRLTFRAMPHGRKSAAGSLAFSGACCSINTAQSSWPGQPPGRAPP
jgi:hypothetical protein